MEYQDNHTRQMAILSAAMPYLPPQNRHAIQMILQADHLVHMANPANRNDFDLEALETDPSRPANPMTNLQGMLMQIQQYLTPKESELVHNMLNIINTGKFFRNYQEFSKMHTQTKGGSDNMMQDFLLSQLAPEQRNTFEQLQNIMYNES